MDSPKTPAATDPDTPSGVPSSAMTTRSSAASALSHVVCVLFGEPEDGVLMLRLGYESIVDPLHLITYEDDQLADFQVPVGDRIKPVPKHLINMCRIFREFCIHRARNGRPVMLASAVLAVTEEEFNTYRFSPDYHAARSTSMGNVSTPTTVSASSSSGPSSSVSSHSPVSDFQKGIKRDITHFKELKDPKHWDEWRRSTVALARAQGVDEVLNPDYTPSGSDAQLLFQEKQKYMYSVFERVLLTDKGKSIVRAYEETSDAQAVYRLMVEDAKESMNVQLDSADLLAYITSARLGDGSTWRGTSSKLIQH